MKKEKTKGIDIVLTRDPYSPNYIDTEGHPVLCEAAVSRFGQPLTPRIRFRLTRAPHKGSKRVWLSHGLFPRWSYTEHGDTSCFFNVMDELIYAAFDRLTSNMQRYYSITIV